MTPHSRGSHCLYSGLGNTTWAGCWLGISLLFWLTVDFQQSFRLSLWSCSDYRCEPPSRDWLLSALSDVRETLGTEAQGLSLLIVQFLCKKLLWKENAEVTDDLK